MNNTVEAQNMKLTLNPDGSIHVVNRNAGSNTNVLPGDPNYDYLRGMFPKGSLEEVKLTNAQQQVIDLLRQHPENYVCYHPGMGLNKVTVRHPSEGVLASRIMRKTIEELHRLGLIQQRSQRSKEQKGRECIVTEYILVRQEKQIRARGLIFILRGDAILFKDTAGQRTIVHRFLKGEDGYNELLKLFK